MLCQAVYQLIIHKRNSKRISFIMRKLLNSTSLVVVPLIISISMLMLINSFGDSATYTQTLFDVGNDYRLKFVDSNDIELGLGITGKVVLPVDILGVCENGGRIVLTTIENAIIISPIECEVVDVNRELFEIKLQAGKINIILTNVLSGVSKGRKVLCGEVLGTVNGNSFFVEVYWGSKKLSLEEIKVLL